MKLNEIIAKYGNADVDESKIKEVLGVKEQKVWKPESGERVYTLFGNGKIDYTHVSIDTEKYYKIGNVYKTKEEAEFARDKQIFLTKFERYLKENEDEPVDWGNENQDKFSILFEHEDNCIRPSNWYSSQFQGTIYTTNEEALKQFVKFNETEIKKYMFGVK